MDLAGIVEKAKKCVFWIKEDQFNEITSDKGLAESFVYFLLLAVVSVIGGAIVQLLSATFQPGILLNIAAIIISMPIGYVIGIVAGYVWIGIMHILLKIVGGKAPFLKTAQIFIYSSTPSFLFGWIPLIGLFALFATLANLIEGSKQVHKISRLRAILAVVVIPVVAILLLLFLAVAYLTPQLAAVTKVVSGG